jgi:predicted DNA-binding transcriptional regulator AlpA
MSRNATVNRRAPGAAWRGPVAGECTAECELLALNRVLPRREAIAFSSMSDASWNRLEQDGKGPTRIQLSTRRVGYRMRDLLEWIDSRSVGGIVRSETRLRVRSKSGCGGSDPARLRR